MKEKLLLKDQLFNSKNVEYLSELLFRVYNDLDKGKFINDILVKFPELELKERYYHVREIIQHHLPNDYLTTLSILKESLKNENDKIDFIFAAYCDYVEVNGCTYEYLDISLEALRDFTCFFSSEFAIRDFINKYPEETYESMILWAQSDNNHIRRLASEGFRPKLPWAKAIDFDYKKGSDTLDFLYYDSERYVTRSVANHLNDISKIDPDFVVSKLQKWKDEGRQDKKELEYIINHSLRTSVKRGHEASMNFLGFSNAPDIQVGVINISNNKISIGESLEFNFDIKSNSNENLVVDYKIIYPTPSSRISEKVFKIKKIEMSKGEAVTVSKNHPFKLMTTKKLYSGEYRIIIQINGKLYSESSFYMEV